MASRYADGTQVSVEDSQREAIQILKRYGATDYMFGESDNKGYVAFKYKGLPVRVVVPKPEARPYAGTGRKVPVDVQIECEKRRQWRVLILWLKGNLEAIENGLLSPYRGFFAYLQLADGRIMAEAAEEADPNVLKALIGPGHLTLPAPKD